MATKQPKRNRMQEMLAEIDYRREQNVVTGTWVKSYDQFGILSETHAIPTVESARSEFAKRIATPGTRFAQWGAKSNDGNIVLGEYRQPGFDHLS